MLAVSPPKPTNWGIIWGGGGGIPGAKFEGGCTATIDTSPPSPMGAFGSGTGSGPNSGTSSLTDRGPLKSLLKLRPISLVGGGGTCEARGLEDRLGKNWGLWGGVGGFIELDRLETDRLGGGNSGLAVSSRTEGATGGGGAGGGANSALGVLFESDGLARVIKRLGVRGIASPVVATVASTLAPTELVSETLASSVYRTSGTLVSREPKSISPRVRSGET